MKLSTKQVYQIRKYSIKVILWLIGGLLLIWLGSFFDPFFKKINPTILNSFGVFIGTLLLYVASFLKIQISIGSLMVFGLIVIALFALARRIKIKGRKLIIKDAKYGSGTAFADITSKINELVIDDKLRVIASNGLLGYDPAPGIVKTAIIKYSYGNKMHEVKCKEGDEISLPK